MIEKTAQNAFVCSVKSNLNLNRKEITMKKDFVFAPILALIAGALFFLKYTGMTAHIVISVVGVVALAAYTVLTKKEWKIPALEIGTRAFYGIALITGIIIKIKHGIKVLSVIHKVSAILFLVAIIALLVTKLIEKKKA